MDYVIVVSAPLIGASAESIALNRTTEADIASIKNTLSNIERLNNDFGETKKLRR